MNKNKFRGAFILSIIVFFILIIGITVIMTLKNTRDLMIILEDSIKSGLISASIASRDLIDVEKFDSYNSLEDIETDIEAYTKTLAELCNLQEKVGATYIYALKQIDGKYYFIFDTDPDNITISDIFDEYEEISEVHLDAFRGKDSVGIMNVADQWGSYSTGAIPVWKDGKIIGIVSVDIEDTYIYESNATADRNSIALGLTMSAMMCAMIVIVSILLRNARKLQDRLFHMANYDVLTGLYNRQYLMDYLPVTSATAIKNHTPFAFLLTDVDNFKRVNDNAGHDAGDELLCHIAEYLNSANEKSKASRHPEGVLSISARIGGDEFVQVIPSISTEAEAQIFAKELLENFTSQLIDSYFEKYQVGLSVGVALFPYHTDNYNLLIKYADLAMYNAKKNGKNNYCIYSEELSQAEAKDLAEQKEKPFQDRRHYRN